MLIGGPFLQNLRNFLNLRIVIFKGDTCCRFNHYSLTKIGD